MRGKANFLGHSIHPMVIVFPLGLLGVAPIFDAIHLATGNPTWAHITFVVISAGLIGGLLAAVPGLIDWASIPRHTRAWRVGLTHALVNVCALALFAVSWVVRYTGGVENAGAGSFILGLLGMGVAMVGGWFGGELVERLSLSVHDDAHLDAPSSLDEKKLIRRPSDVDITPPARPFSPDPVL